MKGEATDMEHTSNTLRPNRCEQRLKATQNQMDRTTTNSDPITNLFPASKLQARHSLATTLHQINYSVEQVQDYTLEHATDGSPNPPYRHVARTTTAPYDQDRFVSPPTIPPEPRRPYHLDPKNTGPNGLSPDYANELYGLDIILKEPSTKTLPQSVPHYYESFHKRNKRPPGREDQESLNELRRHVNHINQSLAAKNIDKLRQAVHAAKELVTQHRSRNDQ